MASMHTVMDKLDQIYQVNGPNTPSYKLLFLIYVIRYMRLMGAGFLNELFTKMSKTAVYKLQIVRCHLIINPVYLL